MEEEFLVDLRLAEVLGGGAGAETAPFPVVTLLDLLSGFPSSAITGTINAASLAGEGGADDKGEGISNNGDDGELFSFSHSGNPHKTWNISCSV